MAMSEELDLLKEVARRLDKTGISYMITGVGERFQIRNSAQGRPKPSSIRKSTDRISISQNANGFFARWKKYDPGSMTRLRADRRKSAGTGAQASGFEPRVTSGEVTRDAR